MTTIQMAIQQFSEFQQLVRTLGIDDSPAEFHGFLSGLVAGGVKDSSWQTLTYQFTNDGHAFSQAPLQQLNDFYQQLLQSYDDTNPLFNLWLPGEEDGFLLADSIAEWASHFLLGLGLAQPRLQTETGEVGEAIADVEEISKLGYDEEEDSADLFEAGSEVVDYLRVVALFLHSHFSLGAPAAKPQIH